MKKYFIILIFVFAFSMNAMAQHLFPEVHFTWTDKNGNEIEYMVPAWDALTTNKERVQKVIPDGGGDGTGGDDGGGDDTGGDDTGGDDTGGDGIVDDDGGSSSAVEPDPESPGWGTGGGGAPGEDIIFGAPARVIRRAQARPMDGIIIASACAIDTRGVGFDGYLPRGGFDDPSPTITIIGSETINGGEYNINKVTYGDIFKNFDTQLGKQPLIQLGTKVYITGDNYSIPETATPFSQDEDASVYNIIGIGDAAYYNSSFGSSSTVFFRATSVTIPKHIKSLGRRCFQAGGRLTKITIADDSEIDELPEGCFAHCMALREINIPASVTKIQAGALGGCGGLGKIVFTADQSPATISENAFAKLSLNSTTTAIDVTKANCAVWVSSMETIREFRHDNAIWNDFAFCIPFEMKKQLISYCSDLILSHAPLVLGSGTYTANTASTQNAWTPDESVQFGGEILKMYYVNKQSTYLDPQVVDGHYTIKLLQMKTSSAKAGFGVLLTGDPGTHELYVRSTSTAGNSTTNNILVGTLEPTDMTSIITDTKNDIYLLKDGSFHLCTGGTLAANKAYLKLPKTTFRTNAKDITIEFGSEEDTDGVQGVVVANNNVDDTWYTLQGIRVETPTHGVFIRGGKKYVIK